MTAPQVFAAWGQSPVGFDPTIAAWTEITADVMESGKVTVKRGTPDEGGQVEPTSCTFTLKNSDGRYSPGYQPGSNWPDVVRRLPIKVTYSGTQRFVGFVESFTPDWPGGTNDFGTMQVVANGVTRRLGQTNDLRGTLVEQVMRLGPLWYYPMDDPQDSGELADVSGNGAAPVSVPWALGQDTDTDLLGLERTSVPNVTGGPSKTGRPLARAVSTTAASYVFWFRTRSAADIVSANGINLLSMWQANGWWQVMQIYPTGGSILYYATDGTTQTGYMSPFVTAADGLWHMAAMVVTSTGNATLYVDGAAISAATSVPMPGLARFVLAPSGPGGDAGWGDVVRLAHFAGFDYELSASQVIDLYEAAATSYAFDTIDQRLTRLAGYAGETISVIASAATAQPQQVLGAGVLERMQETAATDGLLYEMLDGRLGYLPFSQRTSLAAATPYLSLGAQFATLEPVYDDQRLVNRAVVSSDYAVGVAENQASIAAYDERGRDVTTVAVLQSWNQHMAEWIANTNAEVWGDQPVASARVGSVTVRLGSLATEMADWLAGDPLWKRLSITPPPQLPGPIDLVIEGYTEVMDSTVYDVTLACSPLVACFIPGDAALGVLHPQGHTLNLTISAGATSMYVNVPTDAPPWPTSGPFPDIELDGEWISVGAIGALISGRQQFTSLTRGVGGTAAWTHLAGTPVNLRSRHVLAL